ncbi:hypothetical protein RU639_010115 [Aspergillus parasiticus]
MSASQPRQTLQLPPIVLGGSGFSYQVHPDPKSVPISKIIRHAFDVGIKAIDTSPYYDPSEHLLGEALANPEVTSRYARSDYIIMTKVGRISVDKFDYSPDWIRKSVHTFLERLGTTYLDAVFCHDVEYVTIPEAIEAVGTLFDFVDKRADVVQNWAQLTMQNTRLERYGIPALKEAQVPVICNSSPLASGLLRASGVPMGTLGDWYPSPNGLRTAVKRASDWTETQETTLPALRCDSL